MGEAKPEVYLQRVPLHSSGRDVKKTTHISAGGSSLVGCDDSHLLVESVAFALGLHSAKVIQGGVNQAPFIGVHRLKETASAAARNMLGSAERKPNQLLFMADSIVFTVDDHSNIGVLLTDEDVGEQLKRIKVFSFASDDDVGVFAVDS